MSGVIATPRLLGLVFFWTEIRSASPEAQRFSAAASSSEWSQMEIRSTMFRVTLRRRRS